MQFPDVASEIMRMVAGDQAMRERALANKNIVADRHDAEVDIRNTKRMHEITAQIGWPTVSKVDLEASHGAWLLVQHADHDAVFQRRCLALMRAEPATEVDPVDVAYLEDRVRVNEGRPQLYGTQFHGEGASYRPRPIENAEHVDERRKQLGMPSMAEYHQSLMDRYFPKKT